MTNQHLKLYAPQEERPASAADVLAGLITPSRDVWIAATLGRIEAILRDENSTLEDKAVDLLELLMREQGRKVAEER